VTAFAGSGGVVVVEVLNIAEVMAVAVVVV